MKYDVAAFLEGLFSSPAACGSELPGLVLPADAGLRVEDLPGDWRVEWEERAAVLEHDGGHPRERAEALALAEVLGRMLQSGECPPPRP
jgi:hypothetical protein